MAELIIKTQLGEEQTFTLPSETSFELRIGRDETSDILLEDTSVSRRHASIMREGGTYLLRDSNSTTGTTINGRQIQERELNDGDQISFGPVVAFFRVADQFDGSKKFESIDQSRIEIEYFAGNPNSSRSGKRVIYYLHRLSLNLKACYFSFARWMGRAKLKMLEKASLGVAGFKGKNSISSFDGSTSVPPSIRFFDLQQVLFWLKKKSAKNTIFFVGGFVILIFFVATRRSDSDVEKNPSKMPPISRENRDSERNGGEMMRHSKEGSADENKLLAKAVTDVQGEAAKRPALDSSNQHESSDKTVQEKAVIESDIFCDPLNSNCAIAPRGPNVQGLQLGMPYDKFSEAIRRIYPSETRIGFRRSGGINLRCFNLNMQGATGPHWWSLPFRGFVLPSGFVRNEDGYGGHGTSLFNKARENIGEASVLFVAAGPAKSILYFSMERPIILKMFSHYKSFKFDDFCKEFIDEYKIPEIRGETRESGTKEMSYLSPEGWKISFTGLRSGVWSVEIICTPTKY
jgi:hypothetical protein